MKIHGTVLSRAHEVQPMMRGDLDVSSSVIDEASGRVHFDTEFVQLNYPAQEWRRVQLALLEMRA